MIRRIALLLGCGALLFISWTAVLNMRHPEELQAAQTAYANVEIDRGIYANAEPYLLEAVSYNTDETFATMEQLKQVYLELGETQAYEDILETQTSRADCTVAVYEEYARYLMENNDFNEGLAILKLGISRTLSEELTNLYEDSRYAFSVGSAVFEDVTAYHSGGIQVKREGLWGLARGAGSMMVPCEYAQLSTYDASGGGRVVALGDDKKPVAVNLENQLVAIYGLPANLGPDTVTDPPASPPVTGLGTFSQNIIPLRLESGKWILADHRLISNGTEYEDVGACQNSGIALKSSSTGKWGVALIGGDPVVPYEYDEIIMDELGRCYAQNAVFAKKDGTVYLFVDGEQSPKTFEDARPFTNDGWAAVKTDGKWGFIDTTGATKIEPLFDDALSFSGYLAAVRQGDMWGYAALNGEIAIEPQFQYAKSFSGRNAPVLTELGYQFITLAEE